MKDLGRQLDGWHAGSIQYVYPLASQLPRNEFLTMFESALKSASARDRVAVLMGSMKAALKELVEETNRGIAEAAVERFGYAGPSPTERGRKTPEQVIRVMVEQRVDAAIVAEWLTSHVADELERKRLENLARELRGGA